VTYCDHISEAVLVVHGQPVGPLRETRRMSERGSDGVSRKVKVRVSE
jgi:hypothetical protein